MARPEAARWAPDVQIPASVLSPDERMSIILAPKTTFEMTFRINRTYYLQFETPRIDLEQNG